MSEREKRLVISGCLALAAGLALAAFYDISAQYAEFRLWYGIATTNIPAVELVFYLWYFAIGLSVAGFAAAAFLYAGAAVRIENAATRLLAWRWFVPVATLVLFGEILLFQSAILGYAPVTDDENTYRFIAKTLALGRLANPSPGDTAFFRNQFIILDERVWYGQYPIGHPLLLALGDLVGLRFLVVPLVSTAAFLVTYALGRALFSETIARGALGLLLLSPQFVFMAGSELSQPTGSLFMLLALWLITRGEARERLFPLILAGLALGYGLLVRPMPGVLFVLAAGLHVLLASPAPSLTRRLVRVAALAGPVVLVGIAFLLINRAQSGGFWTSGYHAITAMRGHVPEVSTAALVQVGEEVSGVYSASFFGALVRQNFWLFGWPCSLFFAVLLPWRRALFGLAGMIAADYAYRLIVPKTCVATLGPVYLTEIVPLLALASAAGIARVRDRLSSGFGGPWGQFATAWVAASFVVAALAFLPVQLRNLVRCRDNWNQAGALLDQAAKGKALVFSNLMVWPPRNDSWAAYPPNPSPALDDRVIFVRQPPGPAGAAASYEFWKRRFPDRSAFRYAVGPNGAMLLRVERSDDFLR